MNETKPSWMSFLAWPLIGAGIAYSVLGAMTIGLFVFPFVLAGLFAMLKWGGNRKSSVGLISGAGLPFLLLAYLNRGGPGTVCGPYKNGGQRCTQEYSPWPFLLFGLMLVLLGVLLLIRLRSGVALSWRGKRFLVLVLVVIALTRTLVTTHSSTSQMATELGRVQYDFNEIFLGLAKREGVPAPTLPPIRADVASYPDGTKASLWVPNPASLEPRSHCFAVDVARNNSGFGGFFESSCLKPKEEVILERQGSIVVGFESAPRVPVARITSGEITVNVPITLGYFIFPSSVSMNPKTTFTIILTEAGGATCKVSDLVAPGSSASVECAIA